MKIYTKTGDDGSTALFGGGRVGKDDARVDAYGTVDELNSVLGLARAYGIKELDEWLATVQHRLFTVGAILATPKDSKAAAHVPQVQQSWVDELEHAIDTWDSQLPALTAFILPGGGDSASWLHLARTVCRRAERLVVPLHRAGELEPLVVTYLNRLSDALFTAARFANLKAGEEDVPWVAPKK